MWPFKKSRLEENDEDPLQEKIRYKMLKHVLKNTPSSASRDITDKYEIARRALHSREIALFDAKTFNYRWLRDTLMEEGYIYNVDQNDANKYALTDQGRKAKTAGGPMELRRREKTNWWTEIISKTVIPVLSLIVAIVATCNNRKQPINTIQINADSLIRSRAIEAPLYIIHDTIHLIPYGNKK